MLSVGRVFQTETEVMAGDGVQLVKDGREGGWGAQKDEDPIRQCLWAG